MKLDCDKFKMNIVNSKPTTENIYQGDQWASKLISQLWRWNVLKKMLNKVKKTAGENKKRSKEQMGQIQNEQ